MCHVRVPITLRPLERTQLDSMVPRVVDRLEELERYDEATKVENAEIHIDEDTAAAEPLTWATVVGGLEVLRQEDGLRIWWLRKKLSKRLQRKMDEMDIDMDEVDDAGADPGVDAEETPDEAAA